MRKQSSSVINYTACPDVHEHTDIYTPVNQGVPLPDYTQTSYISTMVSVYWLVSLGAAVAFAHTNDNQNATTATTKERPGKLIFIISVTK